MHSQFVRRGSVCSRLIDIAVAAAVIAGPSMARAADLTWNNGASTGNWNTTDANWTGSVWSNATPDSAFFNTNTGTITLTQAISGVNFTFGTGGGSGVNNTGSFAGSALTLSGNLTAIANGNNGPGGPNVSFSNNVSVAGDVRIGRRVLEITGGTFTANRVLSADSWGRLLISGGTVTATNGIDDSIDGGNTLSVVLFGGSLYTPYIRTTSAGNIGPLPGDGVVLSGGTLYATANSNDFIQTYEFAGNRNNVGVGTGGANINTNGFDITITKTMVDYGGAGTLTKSGSGALTLTAANTFTGNTLVSAGKIVLGNASALQNSAYDTASINGGLDLNGNTSVTLGGLTGSANLSSTLITGYGNVTGLTLNPQSGSTKTYSGIISNGSGALTLTKGGAGTQVLSGNNTYSGVTLLSGGILSATSIADNGVSSSIGVGTGDTNNENIGLLFRGGTLQYSGSTAQSTNRQVRLSTIGGGGTIDASGSDPSATLTFTAPTSINFFEGPGNRTLTFAGSNTGTNTFATAIGQAGGVTSVVKSGAGRWMLTGTSSYSGVTTLAGGTLNAATIADNGTASSLGVGTGDTNTENIGLLFSGGALQYTGSTAQSTNRAIRLSTDGGGGTIDASGSTPEATLTFSRQSMPNWWANGGARTLTLTGSNTGANTLVAGIDDISGVTSIAVVKAGPGRWVLAGNGSYVGGTTISAGTLQVGASGTSGSLGSGGVTNNGSLVFNRSDNVTIANGISGSGSVKQAGSGRVELTAVNSYSGGTTVDDGTLILPGNGGVGRIGGSLTVNPDGTVETTGDGTGLGFTGQLTSLVVNGGLVASIDSDNHIFNLGVSMTGGELQTNGGVSSGTGRAFQWTNSPLTTNASGSSAVISGRINLRNDNGNTWSANVADGAALDDLLVTAAMTGSGVNVVKSGAGRMAVTGSNTYTGATSVNAGTLAVNGSLGNTAVTVASGATLGGSGSIAGTATVDGILSPGNSPGVITFGSLVLGGTSTTLIEITGTSRGSAYDGVDITTSSGLTYGGLLSLDFSLLPSAVADNTTFNIFSFLGSPSGNFSSVTSTGLYAGTWTGIGGGNFELVSGGQTLTFSQASGDIIVVPEPGVAVLGGFGLVGLIGLLRRRRR